MFEYIKTGLCKKVGSPQFGKQDRGVSPGGAMDRFSFQIGNILLDNPMDSSALEIIIPPELRFTADSFFVLTGGGYKGVSLILPEKAQSEQSIEHGVVNYAPSGSILKFGMKQYGFRTYLCSTKSENRSKNIRDRNRGPYNDLAQWTDPDNIIRVVEGPEYKYLNDPDIFTGNPWKVSNDLSDMGMRLISLRKTPTVSLKNMISGPVNDGTVQLTPKGPIILLKHRQTIGGYPRIFNVISADVDQLGQFAPLQIIRFKKITMENAFEIARQKAKDLDRFQQRF